MIGSGTSPFSASENPVPQSTLIKVDSKRCWLVEPLKRPTSSRLQERHRETFSTSLLCQAQPLPTVINVNVIDRGHGGIPVKLIAVAGNCLRFLIVIKFIPKRKRFKIDRAEQGHCRSVYPITSPRPSLSRLGHLRKVFQRNSIKIEDLPKRSYG